MFTHPFQPTDPSLLTYVSLPMSPYLCLPTYLFPPTYFHLPTPLYQTMTIYLSVPTYLPTYLCLPISTYTNLQSSIYQSLLIPKYYHDPGAGIGLVDLGFFI